jgi:hypothetical protein
MATVASTNNFFILFSWVSHTRYLTLTDKTGFISRLSRKSEFVYIADDFGSLEPTSDYKKDWKNSKEKTQPTFETDLGGGKSVDSIP